MTDGVLQLLPALALAALAARLWLRARRAERELVVRGRRQHELVTEMARLAERDPLTGLANRRVFDRELRQLSTTGAQGALVVIDLDGFKQVNDRYGHQRGDAVLRDVARELRRRVRVGDVVARLGGDEFAVVLRGADPERAEAVGADLRAGVRDVCAALPLRVPVDASVGIAPIGSGDDGAAELVARADAAMYSVKHARRVARSRRRRFRGAEHPELSSR